MCFQKTWRHADVVFKSNPNALELRFLALWSWGAPQGKNETFFYTKWRATNSLETKAD